MPNVAQGWSSDIIAHWLDYDYYYGLGMDFFEANSGTVPSGVATNYFKYNWIEFDWDSEQTVAENKAGVQLLQSSHTGTKLSGIYKRLGDGWNEWNYYTSSSTITTKVALSGLANTDSLSAGIALACQIPGVDAGNWNGSSYDEDPFNSSISLYQIESKIDSSGHSIEVNFYTDYNSLTTTLASAFISPTYYGSVYLRIRFDNDYAWFDYSTDGVAWQQLYFAEGMGDFGDPPGTNYPDFYVGDTTTFMALTIDNSTGSNAAAQFSFFNVIDWDQWLNEQTWGNPVYYNYTFEAASSVALQKLTASGAALDSPSASGTVNLRPLSSTSQSTITFDPKPSIWLPDAPPSVTGLDDYEFDLNSGGVPAGWAEVDHDGNTTVVEGLAGVRLTQTSHAGNSLAGIYKTRYSSGDWTIWTKVSLSGLAVTSSIFAGLALWEDASSSGVKYIDIWGITYNSTNVSMTVTQYHQGYNTASPGVYFTFVIAVDTAPTFIYLRIRKSGSVYGFDYSDDGVGWVEAMLSSVNEGTGLVHYGICINNSGTGSAASATFPFFRYINSNVGITGLAKGRRVIATGQS